MYVKLYNAIRFCMTVLYLYTSILVACEFEVLCMREFMSI